MCSRRAPRRRLGGLGLLWSSPGALLGGLGRLLARSGRLLEPSWGLLGLPGRAWGSFGDPFAAFWASVEGSLAKSREPRNSLTVQHFLRFSRSWGPQNRLKIASTSLPGASGCLWRPVKASWGCLEPLWAPAWAVCVAPGPSLGGSRPVGNYRNPRTLHQVESQSCVAVKS